MTKMKKIAVESIQKSSSEESFTDLAVIAAAAAAELIKTPRSSTSSYCRKSRSSRKSTIDESYDSFPINEPNNLCDRRLF